MLTEKELRGQCMRGVPASARWFAQPLFATHDPAEQAALASNLARALESAAQDAYWRNDGNDPMRGAHHHVGALFCALFAGVLRAEHAVCSTYVRALPAPAQAFVRPLFATHDRAEQVVLASDLAQALEAAAERAAQRGQVTMAAFCHVGATFAALFADALRGSVPGPGQRRVV